MTAAVVHAPRVAPRARHWFRCLGEARPLHFGREVSYFENQKGEVLGIATTRAGMAPLFVGLPPACELPSRLRVDRSGSAASYEITPTGLRLPKALVLLAGSELWDPRPSWPCLPPAAAVFGSLRELEAGGPPSKAAPWLMQRIEELVDAWPGAGALEVAGSLSGRGEGLTPAGDDCLIGFFYALWARGRTRSLRERSSAQKLASGLSSRTTRLSATMLKSAAAGEAPQAWHRLVSALNRNREVSADLRRDLLDWGASSGRYTLDAFLTAYRRLGDSIPPERRPSADSISLELSA